MSTKPKKLKAFMSRLGSFLVMGLCGVVSVFLLASGYESLYNRSLPLVHTVDPVNLAGIADSYNLNEAAASTDVAYGSYGKPLTLKLPQRPAKLDMAAPIATPQGEWLARANTLHMLLPEKPRNGSIGVTLIYCRTGVRTITPETLPAVGSNIFMDTDRSWRYVYKITSTSLASTSQAYVVADGGTTSKMLIGCYDEERKINAYIEATLLSVQGMDA